MLSHDVMEAGEAESIRTATGTANLVVEYLVRQGLDRTEILREAGLGVDDLEPERRILRAANQRIWEIASRKTRDPALGIHIAQFAEPGALGLVEYLARSSDSIADAVRISGRFERLVHEGITFDVVEATGFMDVTHRTRDGLPQLPVAVDFVAANLLCIARQLAGYALPLISLSMARPSPADPMEWQKFYRCPVDFGQTMTRFRLDDAIANARLTSADSRLHRLLHRQAEWVEASLPISEEFVMRVRAALRETLFISGGRATSVAKRLGISERSMRRRLLGLGQSHRALRDSVRRELAMAREGSVPQIEIALELGFANSSAYRRAFKRWTGLSPRQWRQQNQRDF